MLREEMFAMNRTTQAIQWASAIVVPSLLHFVLLEASLTAPALARPLTPSEQPILASQHSSPTPPAPHPVSLRQNLLTPSASVLPTLDDATAYLPEPGAAIGIHLLIRLSDRRVYVYDRDQLKTSFPIAIGREGWETPTGQWQVMQMIRDPAWQHPFTGEVAPPGADNPLGVRWIGFWTDGQNYIGFHGTPNEASVGTAASHGCIRMYNDDVVKLFELVEIGTPVAVVP